MPYQDNSELIKMAYARGFDAYVNGMEKDAMWGGQAVKSTFSAIGKGFTWLRYRVSPDALINSRVAGGANKADVINELKAKGGWQASKANAYEAKDFATQEAEAIRNQKNVIRQKKIDAINEETENIKNPKKSGFGAIKHNFKWDEKASFGKNVTSAFNYYANQNPVRQMIGSAVTGFVGGYGTKHLINNAATSAANHELKRTAIKWGAGAVGGGLAVGVGAGMMKNNNNAN